MATHHRIPRTIPYVETRTDVIACRNVVSLTVHFTESMLKTEDGATTALGLAIRLLTELELKQLLLPLHGSEFPMHNATLDVIDVHDKVYVEIL